MTLYNTLFEVRVHHDYFLDNGAEKFTSMDPAEQLVQLSRYSLSDYIEIVPTRETQEFLKNHRMKMVQMNDRLRVVASTGPEKYIPVIPIDGGSELRFCIRIRDSYLSNYTDLEIGKVPGRIFLFTNQTPSTEPVTEENPVPFPLIPVIFSDEYLPTPPGNEDPLPPDPDLVGNSFLATEQTTAELLKTISPEERNGLLGMFSILMKTDDVKYDVLDENNYIKHRKGHEEFGIRFQNVKRFWKYKRSDGSFFFTVEEQPLVKYGFIELNPATEFTPPQTKVNGQYYPNAGVLSFEEAEVDGIEAICSVIFI